MIVFLIIIVVLIIWIRKSPKQTNYVEHSYTPVPTYDEPVKSESKEDFSQAYQQKYLFSRNEKSEYRKLYVWATENGFDVFPKVRLADIIEPRSRDNYMSLFGKIKSKHVDFVICDQECRVKFIIELDDNSHNQQKRIERDDFVAQACRGAGYNVLHTRAISEEFLNRLLTQEKK